MKGISFQHTRPVTQYEFPFWSAYFSGEFTLPAELAQRARRGSLEMRSGADCVFIVVGQARRNVTTLESSKAIQDIARKGVCRIRRGVTGVLHT